MTKGIHRKYNVTRTDGTHADCAYFVLDLACDEHAITALIAYRDAVKKTKPQLAKDLTAIIEAYENDLATRCNCREACCPHSMGRAFTHDANETAWDLMNAAERRSR